MLRVPHQGLKHSGEWPGQQFAQIRGDASSLRRVGAAPVTVKLDGFVQDHAKHGVVGCKLFCDLLEYVSFFDRERRAPV